MRIGYPCINVSVSCSSAKTFRIASYSDHKLQKTLENNLNCLFKILKYNAKNNILFFRISSDLVPFASHPINRYPWKKTYRRDFYRIGNFIKQNKMRVNMHPDQFTLINSVDEDIFYRSVSELNYHADVLDLMELDDTNKIQIHVGGAYGNKDLSIKRFVERYRAIGNRIQKRLVIENDHNTYTAADCLLINSIIGIPVVLDVFHHDINNNSEAVRDVLAKCSATWDADDGLPMVDYSSQEYGRPRGSHAKTISLARFEKFLEEIKGIDFDLMLEIKDKEISVLKILKYLKSKKCGQF